MNSARRLAPILTLAASLAFATGAAAAPADLDTTFDTDGIRTESYQVSDAGINATAIDSNGKIVVVGARNVFVAQNDFWIARYNSNGTPDTTFSTDGQQTLDIAGGFDYARDLLILGDGSILVAGNAQIGLGGESNFAVAKFEPDGDPDPTFDTDGKVTSDVGFDDSYGSSIAAAGGGRFVVGGQADGNNTATLDNDFAFARYNANGSLDTTFGQSSSGWNTQSVEVAPNEYPVSIFVLPDDKIVAAGYTQVGIDVRFVVARYTNVGFTDTSFDASGPAPGHTTAPQIADAADIATDAVRQSDGKMVVVGETVMSDMSKNFSVARFNAEGGMDSTFSSDGVTTVSVLGTEDKARAVALEASGNIVVAGNAYNGTDFEDAVVRLSGTGELDGNFGLNGVFTYNPGGFDDGFHSMAVQPSDGKIVLAGLNVNDMNGQFPLLMRLEGGVGAPPAAPVIPAPLTLDATFDGDGKVSTDASPVAADVVNAVATQTDGKTVAVGYATVGGNRLMLVARYNVDGSLDSSFGGDGLVTVQFATAYTNVANCVAIQTDGKIVIGGYVDESGAGRELTVARLSGDGTLDGTFGVGGIINSDLSAGDNQANAIAVQPTGEIVVAGYRTVGIDRETIIGRYTAAGLPDTSFGIGGLSNQDLNSSIDNANAVVIQTDGKIVIAGSGTESANRNAYLARVDGGGTTDLSFSGDGRLTFPVGTESDSIRGMALQTDGSLVAAGVASSGSDEDFFAARIDTAGALDATFDGDGITTTEFSASDEDEEANSVLVQADGRIVAAGFTTYGTDRDFAVARYNTDGSPDVTLDGDGKGSVPMGSENDRAYGITQMADGRVIAGGHADTVSGFDLALIRLGEAPPAIPPAVAPPGAAEAAARIASPRDGGRHRRKKLLKIAGTASTTGSPVVKVEIALRREAKGKCHWLKSNLVRYRKSRKGSNGCSKTTWLNASGTTAWSYKFKRKLPRGSYRLYARAILADGTVQQTFTSGENAIKFKIR